MAKNKSIDGLTPRRSRRPVSASVYNTSGISGDHPTHRPVRTHRGPHKITVEEASDYDFEKPIKKAPVRRTTSVTRPTSRPQRPVRVAKSPVKPKPTPIDIEESRAKITEDFLTPTKAFDFDEETGELTPMKEPITSEDEPKKAKKTKKPKAKMSKKRKIKLWVLGITVVILLAVVIWFIVWGNALLARLTNGQGNLFDLFETYEPLRTDENGRTNILAFGTSGFDMTGTDYDQSTHDGAELTDSIMVISFDQNTGDATTISLPRDFKVPAMCTSTGKINEVFWCNNMDGNDENAGATALMTEVGNVLGLDIQYYAHINWGSLSSLIDSLGGIKVTLNEDIADYGYTDAVYEAGVEYSINGADAVGLARARHGTENGDFSRGASQQAILIGIKNRVLEEGLSVPDMLGIANNLGDNLRTNFSVSELKSLAHIADTIDFENIRQASFLEPEPLMTTADIYGISYVIPSAGDGDYSEIRNYITRITTNDPRLEEDVSILVLNSSSYAGIAATEQAALKQDGYQIIDIDDAPASAPTTGYTLYAMNDSAPKTTEFLESKYEVTAKDASALPAGIPTDYTFVLVVGA